MCSSQNEKACFIECDSLPELLGSGEYWNSAMIRCLGTPHYFVTLSCNDLHWRDMVEALLRADDDPEGS